MKRTLLLSAAFVLASATQAQLSKGRGLIGGAVTFDADEASNNQQPSEYKSSNGSFRVSPYGGRFLRNNLFAGVSLTYGQMRSEQTSAGFNQKNELKEYGGGFFLRRYFPIGGGFYFHVGGSLSYTHSASESRSANNLLSTGSNNNVKAGLSPGVSFAFGKRLIFETGLPNLLSIDYYSYKQNELANGARFYRKGISAGFGAGGSVPLSIGFNILLGK